MNGTEDCLRGKSGLVLTPESMDTMFGVRIEEKGGWVNTCNDLDEMFDRGKEKLHLKTKSQWGSLYWTCNLN